MIKNGLELGLSNYMNKNISDANSSMISERTVLLQCSVTPDPMDLVHTGIK